MLCVRLSRSPLGTRRERGRKKKKAHSHVPLGETHAGDELDEHRSEIAISPDDRPFRIRPSHRTVALGLHSHQVGEAAPHGEQLGIARKDARDDRGDELVSRLGPELSSEEGVDRFILVDWWYVITVSRSIQRPSLDGTHKSSSSSSSPSFFPKNLRSL